MSTNTHGIADDQVRSAFQRWKNLEEEKDRIADDLRELFAEQKAFGHDTKAMRAAFRLKVKMDEARPEDAEHEALVDTYLAALDAPRASRVYARENIEKFDASPRLIKQVVDGMQTEAGRAALIAAVDIMIEREEAENRRSDGGLSILTKHEDIRTAPVTAEESQANPVEEGEHGGCDEAVPTVEAGSRAAEERERQHALTVGFADDCRTGGKEQSDASAAPVGDAAAYAHGIPAISPDQPGEGGADEVTSSAPGAGDETQTSNTGEGAANTALPAKPKVSFRPNCQHPENCASGTRDHCWSCRRAMQKSEEMA